MGTRVDGPATGGGGALVTTGEDALGGTATFEADVLDDEGTCYHQVQLSLFDVPWVPK
jgi:hypothetical protein